MAPAIGRALAEWAVRGRPEVVDPRPFRAARFAEGDPLIGPHEDGDRDYDASRAGGLMLG